MTTRETSFREKTIRESNHPGNDCKPLTLSLHVIPNVLPLVDRLTNIQTCLWVEADVVLQTIVSLTV